MWFNIILLGIVSFITDVSSELIHPILPMFITGLGGTGLVVGLIGGLRDSLTSILSAFSGLWSDKIRRRKTFVGWGYFISALFKLLLSFSSLCSHVLLFSSLERLGKGLRTAPRDAIIADSMPKERGRGFGMHRVLDTLGAIVGATICFVLFWVAHLGLKQIILIAGGIGFIALIPLSFVREKVGDHAKVGSLQVRLSELTKQTRLFILISSIFAFANFSYMFFILRAKEVFIRMECNDLQIGFPILLYVLFNVFYAIGAIPFGMLSDRIGRKWVIVIGYFLFATTCIGFCFPHHIDSLIVLFILYGLAYACIDGNQRAFISDLAPSHLKATALGAFHTAVGIVALPSSLIAGRLWQINPSIAFGVGGAIAIVAGLLLSIMRL